MKKYFMFLLIIFLSSSCAHIISGESRSLAVPDVPFRNIAENTDKYINNVFIFGGMIAGTTNTREGTEIEVVQTPIDKFGFITDSDKSEGRFLAVTSRHLDPLIYKKGRYITLAGRLTGSMTRALGDAEFSYPVFEIKEIHLWREERYYRPYYFGTYYYDPFYYPYSYYWNYPLWPRYYYYPNYFRP